ncbi:hypothetical protein S7711_10448 [Stachybotrys chartarum IBT 7711]|uniref:BZIP domain-containing protein n=1 Tax=Stachybotrys chartarum (strain CBS 109288 / IBT 7711) TaxID=1280523 RepID=A0A084BBR0_STACB|nr:hypothetical protein S7711_10448 [Stachybotrys chartarum IBT 7711]
MAPLSVVTDQTMAHTVVRGVGKQPLRSAHDDVEVFGTSQAPPVSRRVLDRAGLGGLGPSCLGFTAVASFELIPASSSSHMILANTHPMPSHNSSTSPDQDPPSGSGSLVSLASLEKKRARDRRAQQRLRDKRNDRIVELERQVQELQGACNALRQENALLRARQDDFVAPVRSWDEGFSPVDRSGLTLSLDCENTSRGPSSLARQPPERPVWATIPWNVECTPDDEMQARWHKVDPDIIAASPKIPSPLDLLYGSKRNKLADLVHRDMRQWNLRDPECLASGWIMYAYARWVNAPSEASYAQVPEFMRPIPEQRGRQHRACLDGFYWPQLRRNLILKQGQYSLPEVVGMYGCCGRVRWPWGESILVPGEDGEFSIRPDFYKTFMSIEGWGISRDFIRAYPGLLEGLDVDAIAYELR